jgi:DNA-directed RNA polymerase subunit L
MSIEIKNLEIKEKSFKQQNDKLKNIIKIMKEYDDKIDPIELLPKSSNYYVKFHINKSYSGLSNAIRRCLITEIKVQCLDVEMNEIKTDDEFIISDALIKNINLIPINQNYETKELELELYIKNNTNQMIDVYMSDFILYTDKKNKVQGDITELIPEINIPIVKLSPNKYIHIKHFKIIEGYNKDDASKFTLLNNVSYKPLDLSPYDNFTKLGDKSINSNPKSFEISYLTKANIEPKQVMIKCCNTLISRLEDFYNLIKNYIKNIGDDNFYGDEKLEVTRNEDFYIYKCLNEYLTLGNLISQKIYLLDETILYTASTVERLDTEKMIIKVKHIEPDKILQDAINSCIKDLKDVKNYFE